MEKAYKFRIYPNKQQEILIQKTFNSLNTYQMLSIKDIEAIEKILEQKVRQS